MYDFRHLQPFITSTCLYIGLVVDIPVRNSNNVGMRMSVLLTTYAVVVRKLNVPNGCKMNDVNPISQQRLEGSRQITNFARNDANRRGITLDKIPIWDNGNAMRERDIHILQLSANGRMQEDKFMDNELKDFPGGVGTEKTRAKVREMVRSLSE